MPHPRFYPAPLALAVALAIATLGTSAVHAQPAAASPAGTTFNISLAAQPLGTALNELARQAKLQLMVHPDLVAGKSAPAVSGNLTARQALDHLLTGSGLMATLDGSTVVVKAVPPAAGATTLPVVTVTAASDPETATGPVKGYVAKRSATGTKTDTPILETPQSISVVTAEFIEATGSTRLRDALAYTPGIDISPYGSDSRMDDMNLRGFSILSPGYYLDGLQLRNNNSGGYGAWQTENYGTERIEVLRGPASVLYGQNGPGGMVNVVSKRPTAEPLRELQVQLGGHSRRQIAGDFSGPLDEEGKLLYRITGLVRDAEFPLAGLPNDRLYIAPSLTWRPSSDTSLTLFASYLRSRAGSTWQSYPAVGTLLPNPNGVISRSTFMGEPGFNRYNLDQSMLGYTLEHRLNDTWSLSQSVRYGRVETDYADVYMPGGFVTVNAANAADPANFQVVRRMAAGGTDNSTNVSIDNHLQARLKSGNWQHTLLFGLDYQHSNFDQYQYYGGTVANLNVYAPVYGGSVTAPSPYRNANVKLAQTGLYLQDQIKFGERWVATLGGRYDRAASDTDNHLTNTNTQKSDGKFTGRAGLVYLAANGWAPYVNYSESFAPVTTINPSTGKLFDPESGRQYEAGIRYQPIGRKDSYSAAVFDLRRRNYITYDSSFAPTQTGEVTVRGLELEASVQPIANLNLMASYAWTPKADVTASANAAQIGKQLMAVSEHRLSLWADYRFSNGLKAGIGARYVGSNHGQNGAAPAKVPAYTLLDAMLGYDFDRWSLALNLRNLTNKAYIASCINANNCFYGDPRSVIATATYRW